ncbi:hypothetical protein D6T69_06820 [Tenacibaculum singaporense]|uniref:Uncharacterized protein n=1 Tax=Tenacibaculum singaporense TaxID=2358479 RepID=A0A3Q8RN13_9FLAO|nr:hypothetical protein [Tenacibaculum singaporense]AZJ35246.1 hypothetical protein D6T69_06820 [Tenacibaculum singaporense]
MKFKQLLIYLMFSTQIMAQSFNGEYKSLLTSFKSEIDSTRNYKEKAEFNLLISNEYIVIQDIRLPKKLLIYKCKKPLKKLFNIFIKESCNNEHMENNSKSNITFYNSKNKLNLMISDKESSQVFFNLIKNKLK